MPVAAWIFGGGYTISLYISAREHLLTLCSYIYGWKSQAGGPQSFFQAAKEQDKDVIYVRKLFSCCITLIEWMLLGFYELPT